jgi:WD40 repeat protein
MERGDVAFAIRAHADAAWGSALSPDGQRWASASRDGTVKVWRLNPEVDRIAFSDGRGEIKQIIPSHDGRLLAAANEDGSITLWDPDKATPVKRLAGGGGAVYQIEFSPNGEELGALEETNAIRFWSVAEGRTVRKLEGERAFGFTWSPDGSRLLTAHPDGTSVIRDAKTLEKQLTLAPPEDERKEVIAHVYSRDGRYVATGESLGSIRLWDTTSGEEIRRFTGHTDAISGLAFSVDDRRLYSSGFDGLVYEWDVATGKSLRRMEAEPSGVLAFGPSPQDTFATSLGFDRTITVWQLPDWNVLMVMRTGAQIWTAAFSLDEQRLYVGERDLIRVIPADFSATAADPSKLLEQAQRDAALALVGFELQATRGRPKSGTGQGH